MDLQMIRPLAKGDPLWVPEILQQVFQAADESSLSTSARVCRRWSTMALDQLWRSLSSILPLLTLLAPKRLILWPESLDHSLADALMKADWDRFRHYTQRVRSVNLENVWEMEELPLNSAALIRMFHGVSAILPNVKEISWSFWNPDNSPAVIPFLGPQLEKLCLNTYPWMDTTAHEQVQLFQSLTGHIQSLRSLEIASLSPVRCPKTLATLIGSCPNLRLLDLPPYYLTKEVVAAAARLPHLEILYCDVSPGTERNYTGLGMEFEFTANSFPQLKKASFAAFPLRMAEIFQAPAHIANLEAVDLNCPLDGSTEEIKTIFANLAAGAPMLQDIRLVCTPIRQLQATSGFESLSIDTISPLFSCTYLTDFILLAPCFRPLTAEDLIQMGKSWPRISSLGICPTPLVDDYPGTDINLLSAFAQSFPLLNELVLFFHTNILGFDGNFSPHYTFKNLEKLGVGMSPCPQTNVQDVGLLIASLCTRLPSLTFGYPDKYQCYRGEADNIDELDELLPKDFTDCWKQVQNSMEVAFRTKTYLAR